MTTYNPELKKKYDADRYKKQKEEFFKLNPYYIPVRTQQRLKREALQPEIEEKIKTEDEINAGNFVENLLLNYDVLTPAT